MKVIPGDLRDHLKGSYRAGHRDLSGQEPAYRKGIERAKGSPADRLEYGTTMRLATAEQHYRRRRHIHFFNGTRETLRMRRKAQNLMLDEFSLIDVYMPQHCGTEKLRKHF
jgi:hypothetical protein